MPGLVPLVAALLVIASGLWVLSDARRLARSGTPVVLQVGAARIDTPQAWSVGCVLVWVVFFPTYVAARRH